MAYLSWLGFVAWPLVQERLGVPAMSANRAIERLVTDGVLREVTGTCRDRIYEAKEVLLALDGFAVRGGRRARGTTAPVR